MTKCNARKQNIIDLNYCSQRILLGGSPLLQLPLTSDPLYNQNLKNIKLHKYITWTRGVVMKHSNIKRVLLLLYDKGPPSIPNFLHHSRSLFPVKNLGDATLTWIWTLHTLIRLKILRFQRASPKTWTVGSMFPCLTPEKLCSILDFPINQSN